MIRLSPDAYVTTEENRPAMSGSEVTDSSRAMQRFVLAALVALVAIGAGCRERNGNDGTATTAGIPTANFTVDVTSGTAGLAVQFTDTSTGAVDAVFWEFGNGETRTTPNPMITFDTAGTYDVKLTVTGSRGSSEKEVVGLIEVVDTPVAGFSCDTASGFAPLTVTCASSAVGAASTTWTFTNGTTADTVVSTEANATVILTTGGDWSVRQEVSNLAGTDSADSASPIAVQAVTIAVASPLGPGPGATTLTIDFGDGNVNGLGTWIVNGQPLVPGVMLMGAYDPASSAFPYTFETPGDYEITFQFVSFESPDIVEWTRRYEVLYVRPTAEFVAESPVGPGPLTVVFDNRSMGEITETVWNFGDSTSCVWPAPEDSVADPRTPCDAASPSHTYSEIGRYDVSLLVTGPNEARDADEVDASTQSNLVTVTILDPGFEAQEPAEAIAGAWDARAGDDTSTEQHVALSQVGAEGADAGMPTEGDQWAVLDGLGTDGSASALTVDNRIETRFVLPADRPVVEFDYALLFSEPPAGFVLDAMTATVTGPDDTNALLDKTVEVNGAAADAWSAYDGGSSRFPTLDGSQTRMTPIRVASLDVAMNFPNADPDTEFTLSIRLTNDTNAFRPPRAYVDAIRFVATSETDLAANFTPPPRIVAGEPADFVDMSTCPDPTDDPCSAPSSWRWDFGTRESITPPTATGSALQDPSYVFDEPGDFDVSLWARNADQADEAVRTVTVLEAPVAIPVVVSVTPVGPYWRVEVGSVSTADGLNDSIESWSWDFAGWGDDPDEFEKESPAPFEIRQAGTWTVRLTIGTMQGLEATGSVDVVVN